jgi:peptidyl-prolyl cis-trans isomerase D
MLSLIREHADSWLIKSILWLIVFAFVGTIFYSWGVGENSSGSNGGVVATVNGSKITQAEYERTFNNLINFYREQLPNQFSDELIQKLDLKKQALDILIQKKILLLKANELDIRVSDQEVVNQINIIPTFQKDKVFNNTIYQNYLNYNRLTPLEFEESQREAVLLEKISNLIKSNVKVSPGEIDEAFIRENEKIKLDYIKFSNNHFKSSDIIKKEDVTSFFEKNKTRFEVPEKIKIEYVKIVPKNYVSSIDIQSEDINDYYKTKIANFRIPKMYKASHILFRVKPQSDSSDESIIKAEKQAKKEAEDILKKIKNGTDFGELAKKYSDDPESGKNGGSLGEFPVGVMLAEFENALENLKPKEISQPIKTSYGFHIIRLEEVNPERIKPLKEVKDEIVQKIKEIKTRQKMRRTAKHIHRSAKKDQNLALAAQENQLAVQTTQFISRQNHVDQDIGANPDFFNQAFTLEDNKIGEPVYSLEAAFVLKIVARQKAYIPELNDIEELVQKKAQEDKDLIASIKKSEEVAKKISNATIDLESASKELGLELQHTPYFNRSDSIPGIGNLKEVKSKAFELDKGKSGWVAHRNNYYLIRLQERVKADTPKLEELEELRTQLKLEKGNTFFLEWTENLKEKSDILIDKSKL